MPKFLVFSQYLLVPRQVNVPCRRGRLTAVLVVVCGSCACCLRSAVLRFMAHGIKRKLVCMETGVVFESVSAAGRWLGLSRRAVHQALERGCRAGGYHWREVRTPEPEPDF
eukprot:g79816.t1